ncbi:tRNA (cytosine(34)-c(5))-methyltransferase [Anaeramoeba flamelloides]|uniref:tRNA (Cytosine(34)-c(5))-methyltransferase n=1 Tax=Anaeramoeba flamelloides TaxID=1746091 RepID=A0ABQ8Y0U8_9EUKA|nr:tRNA (cytosine(34)-c(5))-methyltransferase [Anaeramoeba flamelloides]
MSLEENKQQETKSYIDSTLDPFNSGFLLPTFVEYYEEIFQRSNFLTKKQYDRFLEQIRLKLPIAFRVLETSSSKSLAMEFLVDLKKELNSMIDLDKEFTGELTQFEWYPNKTAFQLNAYPQQLRKNKKYFALRKFLREENERAGLSRQEVVSMFPPLCLNLEKGDKILDLCAAPGSKTIQLIELLKQANEKGNEKTDEGFVIANDVSSKRCHTLFHRLKKVGEPNLIVTSYKAQLFPNLLVPLDEKLKKQYEEEIDKKFKKKIEKENEEKKEKEKEKENENENKNENEKCLKKPVLFDKVLADVPCTGDGTFRKTNKEWENWSPKLGIQMHDVQFQIVKRGVELLKPGGRLVYSTCSMNPLENEAVVARLLNYFGLDTIHLVDPKTLFENKFEWKKGMKKWKVLSVSYKNKGGKSKQKTVDNDNENDENNSKTTRPKNLTKEEEEKFFAGGGRVVELSKMSILKGEETKNRKRNTKKVIWFDSYDQVPERLHEHLPESLFPPSEELGNQMELDKCMRFLPYHFNSGGFFVAILEKNVNHPTKKYQRKMYKKDQFFNEAPFYNISQLIKNNEIENTNLDDLLLKPLQLNENFPKESVYSRSKKIKNILYLGKGISQIMDYSGDYLHIVNGGVRIAALDKFSTRFTKEGLKSVFPYTKRKLPIEKEDLKVILTGGKSREKHAFSEKLQKQLEKLGNGPIIFFYNNQNYSHLISAMVGKNRIAHFIEKNDKMLILSDINKED